jgi:lysophospholipid hydrolase
LLSRHIEFVDYKAGDEIFGRSMHDGSLLIILRGTATLTIHEDDGKNFSKNLEKGDRLSSPLSLLAKLLDEEDTFSDAQRSIKHFERVNGRLSSTAVEDVRLLKISWQAIQKTIKDSSENFLLLAQAALTQVEKVTAKSLVDHFGIPQKIINPRPLLIFEDDVHYTRKNFPFSKSLKKVMETLGLKDDDNLFEKTILKSCKLVEIGDGRRILEDGYSSSLSGVYIVLEGSAMVQMLIQNRFVRMYEAFRGCEVGIASCIIGYHVETRLVAHSKSLLLWIPAALYCTLLKRPSFARGSVYHLVEQLSDLVCLLDSSFEWVHLHGGESLFHRGNLCDSVSTILTGRLRCVQEHVYQGKTVHTTSELVRGATLGALDMLSGGRSTASVYAIRDSQIAQMSRNVFDYVINRYPNVLVYFTTQLAKRIPKARGDTKRLDGSMNMVSTSSNFLLSLGDAANLSYEKNRSKAPLPLSTLAVVSLSHTKEIGGFCQQLLRSFESLAKTDVVSSKRAHRFLGESWRSDTRLAHAKLSSWLGDIEIANELVIYEGDEDLNPWTKLCLRQADHILLLCSEDDEDSIKFSSSPAGSSKKTKDSAKFTLEEKLKRQRHLEKIQEMEALLSSAWERKNVTISVIRLRPKNWTGSSTSSLFPSHQQIQASYTVPLTPRKKRHSRMDKKLKKNPPTSAHELLPRFLLHAEKYEWISYFHNIRMPFQDHKPDFDRLSRRIAGRSVGLVLGGGGARGLAHLGVLRALEECGIDIDVVGGTSIGSFIGAVYALHPHDLLRVEHKVRRLSNSMSSILEKLLDLTLPIASFFSGMRFNEGILDIFRELKIEDLLLNYFCITTDIAKSRMSVHRSGPVWKYVRASMSLQGYLPPISEDGSLLLDGGYMNNLPADVMKDEGGVRHIIAVDVGREPRRVFYPYGSKLSGWWLLWNKLNPFATTVSVPSMGDVSAALAYVSSEQHKDRMKDECIDLYLRPPIQAFGTLEFGRWDEIVKVGYDYALPHIKKFAERLKQMEVEEQADEPSALTNTFQSMRSLPLSPTSSTTSSPASTPTTSLKTTKKRLTIQIPGTPVDDSILETDLLVEADSPTHKMSRRRKPYHQND